MSVLQSVRGPMAYMGNRNPMLRLALYHHRVPSDTEHGAALSFRHFPFMMEPFAVLPKCPDMVAQKCTQVGWTEMTMVFMVVVAGLLGRKVAYIMPHDGMVKTFVQEKFAPMVGMVPLYREISRPAWRAKPTENLALRQFGVGSMRFLGSRTRSSLRSFTADCIIIDELDDCEQANLSMAKDRIRNSLHKQQIRLGNPALAGRGISRLYDQSDGRQWYHKCHRCNEQQPIDWFANVVRRADGGHWEPRDRKRATPLVAFNVMSPDPSADIRPVCRRCEEPFERTVHGQWVAQRPDQPRRGYHVSQMDVPSRSLWDLFVEFMEAWGDPDMMRNFYSGVLGKAYEKTGARVTEGDLRAAIRPYETDPFGGDEYEDQTVSMGVDVGSVLNTWVTVYDEEQPLDDEGKPVGDPEVRRRCVWVGAFKTWDELEDAIKRYHVDVCVMDHGPERTKAEEFRDWAHANTRCRVWLCDFYLPNRATKAKWGMRLDEAASSVMVGRTALLDTAFADLRSGKRTLPEDVFNTLDFANQMSAPVRVLSKKADRYIWWSGSGTPAPGKPKKPDHYRLADGYDRLAFELLSLMGGYIEIDLYGDDDED